MLHQKRQLKWVKRLEQTRYSVRTGERLSYPEEETFEPARRFTEAALKARYDEQDILLPSIGDTVALDVQERICELESTGT